MKKYIVKNIDNKYCLCKAENDEFVGNLSTDAVAYLSEGQELEEEQVFPMHIHDEATGAPIFTDEEGFVVEVPIYLVVGPCGHWH